MTKAVPAMRRTANSQAVVLAMMANCQFDIWQNKVFGIKLRKKAFFLNFLLDKRKNVRYNFKQWGGAQCPARKK